ncbi:chloride channel protein [Chryseotalea sanaruensis]|uniref:chloride channel protein n=1 Tax=Chryseotalea sanaruensis TaxID=2482724 RepID=UPI000F8F4D2C|nr:chloride channel protein [Chryseotalea sanaruensis]
MIDRFNRIARGIIFFRHHLSDKQFLIVSSIIVGLLSGGAAVILKSFVHSIQHWIERYSYEDFFLVIFFPLVGIAFTVLLINTIWKHSFKKGSAEITYAITKKSSQLPLSHTYSHIITSAITVGFGGSTGLESPMVSTGSAIGSNVARAFRLSYKEKTILLACGASAGIAAAFNSPIAGVLFAIEVLLADISAAAFIPLIVAAATGALLAKIILAEGVLLTFTLVSPFDHHNTHYYLLLGLLSGFVALYYARSFDYIHDLMKKIKSTWIRVLIGGVLLAGLVLFFPSLLGEGYESIKSLSNLNTKTIFDRSIVANWVNSEYAVLLFLSLVVLLKSVAAAITIGSGGNGGSFGPSLFMGAYLGFVFARLLNMMLGTDIPEVNFALVGMAGMLSGVFYAPLTAIFLIAEITGGYGLIIPLMMVSAMSLAVANYFQPKSMEGKKLAKLLNASIDDRDQYLLSRLDLSQLIETNFLTIKPTENLEALRKTIAVSTRNTFAVVNDAEELVGIIQLDDVRQIIFSADATETLVKDLMNIPAGELTLQDNLQTALKKFDTTGLWNLPVVDKKRYVGFISKSSLLARYRNELIRSA